MRALCDAWASAADLFLELDCPPRSRSNSASCKADRWLKVLIPTITADALRKLSKLADCPKQVLQSSFGWMIFLFGFSKVRSGSGARQTNGLIKDSPWKKA